MTPDEISGLTDDELVCRALDRAVARGDKTIPGASARNLRLWRAKRREGIEIAVQGAQRAALVRYLTGASGSADYWRGVLQATATQVRALAVSIEQQLAAGDPATTPAAEDDADAAQAQAAAAEMGPPRPSSGRPRARLARGS